MIGQGADSAAETPPDVLFFFFSGSHVTLVAKSSDRGDFLLLAGPMYDLIVDLLSGGVD
jgi:hypothetical protein